MNKIDLKNVSDGFLAFSWSNLSPCNRAKVMAGSPKTVWLFGAGASHHYNLNSRGVQVPLANGFFEAFNSLPTSEGFHAHVGPLISFLGHYRGVKPHEVSQWNENIEDFMTDIEAGIAEIREKKSKGVVMQNMSKGFALSAVFNNMNFIFANVINEAQNGPSESIYRYLLDFCGPDDTFITFNWDTLLDRALVDTGGWNPNDGYGVQFSSVLNETWKQKIEGAHNFTTNWKLLKLHGSTNWLVPLTHVHLETFEYISSVPDSNSIFLYWHSTMPYETHRSRWRGGYVPTCYCYYPPNIPTDFFTQKQLSSEPGKLWVKFTPLGIFSPFDELAGDGIPASPLLITPIRQKKYDIYQSTINNLWLYAADSLKTTSKIVIVGYSFPSTDMRALELLGNALNERKGEITVEIVAPDAAEIVSRIEKEHLMDAKNVVVHDMVFEEYLQVLAGNIPSLMKKAAAENDQIQEWLEKIYVLGEMSRMLPIENSEIDT
jgi:hypothetical protein